jgi:ABC-type nitrate/sulfonate/bicarbonate transport system substrate-binding protein
VKITARKIGTGDRLDISQIDVINGHDFDLLKEGRGAILAVHPFSRKSDFEKAMLVKKSAGISDWKDFKGKGVVVADAGSDMPMLNRVFGEHGLKTMGTEGRDVTLWGGGGAVSGFAANKDVHALYGWSSTVLPLMRQRPDDFVILWKDLEKKESPESPLVACSYVKASLLPEKREAVKAYARAIDRAIDLIRHDPSGAVGILPKYFDVDKKWASTMEVYDFHKSGEAVDLKGLSGKLGFDVEGSLLSLSEK